MFCFRCGKQVAGGAEYCPYCGAWLEDGVLKEKNGEREDSFHSCRQTERDTVLLQKKKGTAAGQSRSRRSRWGLWAALGVFLCVLIAAAVVWAFFSRPKQSGSFRNVSWGMTGDEVEKAETAVLTKREYKDGESVLYAAVEDLKGAEKTPVEVQYSFTEEEKLYGVSIGFAGADQGQAWERPDETGTYLQATDYLLAVQAELEKSCGKPVGIDWGKGSASVFLADDTIAVLMTERQRFLLYDKEYFEKAWPETYAALLASPGSETVKIQEAPVKRHIEARVAVDTGHTPLMSADGLAAELEESNFGIQEFDLLADEIPEGTQAIILPSPSTDLTEAEVEKVSEYLNEGETSEPRNLVVLYTPKMEEMPNLNGLMNEWGLDVVSKAEVIATSDGSYVQYQDYMIANATDEVDLGGQASYGYLLAPVASPVEVLWDGRNEVATSVLMTSPEDAERIVYNEESGEMETASSGRETLIAMGTKIYTYAGNSCRNSNVVAVGCGLFVDNTFLASSAFSNREYAVDLFMYLTDTGE